MISVINEAESFESAPVAAARERMVTACNVPASAAIALCGQTTWNACVSIARDRWPLAAAPAGAAKRRHGLLVNGASFFHAVFIVARAVISRREITVVPTVEFEQCSLNVYEFYRV